MLSIKRIILTASFASLFSCSTVGPDYKKPKLEVNSKWKFEEEYQLNSKTDREWWKLIDAPEVSTLIQICRQENPDLEAASLRILEARAILGIAEGNYWPQKQNAFGGASADQISDNAANSAAADSSYKNYSVGASAVWELDFWGKYSHLIQGSKAQFEAEIAAYDNFLIALYAEIASTYVRLRVSEERITVARFNVLAQQRNLKIAKVLFNNGDVSELDLQQATIILNDTLSKIPRFEANIRKAKNSLAVLVGRNPGAIDDIISQHPTVPKIPETLAIHTPAELLRRRPDIRLAERLLAAQSELIGVAQADLYPHISLVGSLGFNSSNSSLTKNNNSGAADIFSKESIFYSVGPSFSWDILNYGRLKNRIRVEDSRFEQLAQNYRKSILNAQLEVENSMTDYRKNKESLSYIKQSVEASKKSLKISETLYRNGETEFNRVLDSLQAMLNQQNRHVDQKGKVVLNLISLYKSLGGGWQDNATRRPQEKTIKRMTERTDWDDMLSSQNATSPSKEDK